MREGGRDQQRLILTHVDDYERCTDGDLSCHVSQYCPLTLDGRASTGSSIGWALMASASTALIDSMHDCSCSTRSSMGMGDDVDLVGDP